MLRRKYRDVHFLGYRFGEDLVRYASAADVFVFPSRTDTFGLVLLEAMACGVPVAAFPVTGPVDVVRNGVTGALDHDLRDAITAALNIGGRNCRPYALRHSWDACTAEFLQHLRTPGDGRYPRAPLRASSRWLQVSKSMPETTKPREAGLCPDMVPTRRVELRTY